MQTCEVPTDQGLGRLSWDGPQRPVGVLLLGGGASGQIHATDLDALGAGLPGHGWAVARFEFAWRLAGRSIGPRPPASDAAWLAATAVVRERWPGVPLVTGGRSAGARIACRTADADLAGVLALSFPLHPPGKPATSRVGELAGVPVPVALISGARDPFGTPDELWEALTTPQRGARTLTVVPGATHSFPARTADAVLAATLAFLGDVVGPQQP